MCNWQENEQCSGSTGDNFKDDGRAVANEIQWPSSDSVPTTSHDVASPSNILNPRSLPTILLPSGPDLDELAHQPFKEKLNETSSESEGTIILEQSPANGIQDESVPILKRTDSVILNRKILGLDEDLSSCVSSEDEYVPGSESDTSEDTDTCVDSVKRLKRIKGGKKPLQPAKTKSATVPVMEKTPESFPASHSDDPSDSHRRTIEDGESTSDLKVLKLKKKEDGGRLYNKRFYCCFCQKPFSKISRHFEAKHKDKPEVAKALKSPKGSKERKIQIALLRNRGNRVHNLQVIREGKGTVVPRQQSSRHTNVKDYLHCINCEAYLKRRSMWRHMQRCQLSKQVSGLKPGKSRVQALCQYAEPVPASVNEHFWKLVLSMHDDEITDTVRSERSILQFGEHLFNKHGQDPTKHEYIRQKMRETGRVTLQGKKKWKVKDSARLFCSS